MYRVDIKGFSHALTIDDESRQAFWSNHQATDGTVENSDFQLDSACWVEVNCYDHYIDNICVVFHHHTEVEYVRIVVGFRIGGVGYLASLDK